MVEQDCAYLDLDDRDQEALHLCGWDGEALAAYLRVLPPERGEASIGRVITAPSHRGRGLGRPLMRRGMQVLRDAHGDVAIHLSAQAHLEGFYRSLGFETVGEGYLEDGIPHLPMRLG